jgi:thioredoxin 1
MKLIFFHSSWCGPCKALAPIVEELKSTYDVWDIDVDEAEDTTLVKYKIRSIPVLILEDDQGKELWKHVGSISKIDLENKLKEYETN